FYKTFHANSIIILPITFFALDLLNGLSNADTPVAYWAHFGGAIFGLSIGLFSEKTKPIHWPMLYSFEEDIIKNISQTSSTHDRIYKSIDLLRTNPENI